MVVSGIHVNTPRVDAAALTALAEFPDTTPRGIHTGRIHMNT